MLSSQLLLNLGCRNCLLRSQTRQHFTKTVPSFCQTFSRASSCLPLTAVSHKCVWEFHEEICMDHSKMLLTCTDDTAQASTAALALFEFGQAEAAKRGLLLVDTKYEMGRTPDGRILLIDEVFDA